MVIYVQRAVWARCLEFRLELDSRLDYQMHLCIVCETFENNYNEVLASECSRTFSRSSTCKEVDHEPDSLALQNPF